METHVGEFVYVFAGRDKGKCFIILSEQDKYIYLCDGKGRKVTTPKKKSVKHIRFTGIVEDSLKGKMISNENITDKEVRRAVSKFLGYIK